MRQNYPEHLLEQAEMLLSTDPRRPRQANLRRAISAAYYAIFHSLIGRTCDSLVGALPSRRHLRDILTRGFEHGVMADVSRSFAGGTLPGWMQATAPPIPDDLRTIATSFLELLEARHRADYHLSRSFTRYEAEELVSQARNAIALWQSIAESDATRLFQVGLLCWKSLRQR